MDIMQLVHMVLIKIVNKSISIQHCKSLCKYLPFKCFAACLYDFWFVGFLCIYMDTISTVWPPTVQLSKKYIIQMYNIQVVNLDKCNYSGILLHHKMSYLIDGINLLFLQYLTSVKFQNQYNSNILKFSIFLITPVNDIHWNRIWKLARWHLKTILYVTSNLNWLV